MTIILFRLLVCPFLFMLHFWTCNVRHLILILYWSKFAHTCVVTVVALIIKRHSIFYSILFSRVALTFSATCINLYIDFEKYNSESFPWGEREKSAIKLPLKIALTCARKRVTIVPWDFTRGTPVKRKFSSLLARFSRRNDIPKVSPCQTFILRPRGEYQQTKQIKHYRALSCRGLWHSEGCYSIVRWFNFKLCTSWKSREKLHVSFYISRATMIFPKVCYTYVFTFCPRYEYPDKMFSRANSSPQSDGTDCMRDM